MRIFFAKSNFYFFLFQAAEFLDISDLFQILNEATGQKLANLDKTDLHTNTDDQYNKTLLGLEDLCLSDGLFRLQYYSSLQNWSRDYNDINIF